MTEIDIEQLLKILPKLIRENDQVKGAILTALTGVIATKEDIKELIREMDKRFEAMQQQMDKRFEAMDRKMDDRFDKVMGALANIQQQIGKPFEQFARNVICRILAGEGIPNVRLESKRILDPQHLLHPSSSEFEVDGFSEKPPVLVEITSILKDKTKVEMTIKKKQVLETYYHLKYRGFLVAASTDLNADQKADAIAELRQHGIELINL